MMRSTQGRLFRVCRRACFAALACASVLGSVREAVSADVLGAGAPPPLAEVLGRAIYEDELVSAKAVAKQKAKLAPEAFDAWFARARSEKLQALVWSAVFDDYIGAKGIEATPQEIESYRAKASGFLKETRVRRERDREALLSELTSTAIDQARRAEARAQLDALDTMREHDARAEQERRRPEGEKKWQARERRAAEERVRKWKVDRELFREFGGRIVFRKSGWEPIDAYRKLLDRYEERKALVVREPDLRDALFSHFTRRFLYADSKKAAYYFEKPYWERSPEEIQTGLTETTSRYEEADGPSMHWDQLPARLSR